MINKILKISAVRKKSCATRSGKTIPESWAAWPSTEPSESNYSSIRSRLTNTFLTLTRRLNSMRRWTKVEKLSRRGCPTKSKPRKSSTNCSHSYSSSSCRRKSMCSNSGENLPKPHANTKCKTREWQQLSEAYPRQNSNGR